jgi:hypothetical protein
VSEEFEIRWLVIGSKNQSSSATGDLSDFGAVSETKKGTRVSGAVVHLADSSKIDRKCGFIKHTHVDPSSRLKHRNRVWATPNLLTHRLGRNFIPEHCGGRCVLSEVLAGDRPYVLEPFWLLSIFRANRRNSFYRPASRSRRYPGKGPIQRHSSESLNVENQADQQDSRSIVFGRSRKTDETPGMTFAEPENECRSTSRSRSNAYR